MEKLEVWNRKEGGMRVGNFEMQPSADCGSKVHLQGLNRAVHPCFVCLFYPKPPFSKHTSFCCPRPYV